MLFFVTNLSVYIYLIEKIKICGAQLFRIAFLHLSYWKDKNELTINYMKLPFYTYLTEKIKIGMRKKTLIFIFHSHLPYGQDRNTVHEEILIEVPLHLPYRQDKRPPLPIKVLVVFVFPANNFFIFTKYVNSHLYWTTPTYRYMLESGVFSLKMIKKFQ